MSVNEIKVPTPEWGRHLNCLALKMILTVVVCCPRSRSRETCRGEWLVPLDRVSRTRSRRHQHRSQVSSCVGGSFINQLVQLVAGAAQVGPHGAAQLGPQGAAQLGAQLEPQQRLRPQCNFGMWNFGMQSFGHLKRWQRGLQPLLQLLQELATGAQQAGAQAGAAQVGAQVGAQAGAAQLGAQAGAAQLGAAEQQLPLL